MTQSTPDPTPTVTEHDFTVRENRPGKVLAVHLNYPSRIAQRGRSPQAPGYFLKAGTSLARTGDTIERPAGTELLAYEGEIALIIGRTARRVSPEEGWSHVSGITAANDWGLYDLRHADKGSNVKNKSGDGYTPLGPAVISAAGLDPAALRVRTWVNGEIVQDDTTEGLVFPFGQLVADLSQLMTLEEGDVILPGPPAGSSVARPGHGGAGGGAGEDDVALLERHELREVGHELAEREDEALGGVVLDDLAVDPGAHAQGGRVQARGGDHRGAERGVAVAGLVLDVGALVRVAEVVEAPVVGGGDAGDVRPALLRADAPGGAADDQRDLALVGEQLGAGGALDGVAGAGEGGAGLEEVAGGLRGPAPLGDAGGVVQVDGEHLARPVLPDGEVVLGDGGRGIRCALRHGRDRIRSRGPGEGVARPADAVSYTHLTLPTKRIV